MQASQASSTGHPSVAHASTSPPDDPVLRRLDRVYSWWLGCLEGPEHRDRRRGASAAPAGFRNGWRTLLPWERERALDLLVSTWCSWQADRSRVDPDVVLTYSKLSGEVKHIISTIKPHTAEKEHVKLLAIARNILALYPSDNVKAWFVSLFTISDRTGLTTSKLRRVPQDTWYLIQQTLETGLEWLREGVPAQQALPSVDLLFDAAHRASQTVSERYAIFHRCVDDLLNLHSASRLDEHVSRAGRAAYLDQVRSVLLAPGEAHRFDMRLDVAVQVSAVEVARAWLFTTCTRYAQAQRLPKLEDVARELYLATGHDKATAQLALAPPPSYYHAEHPSSYIWMPTATHADPPEGFHTLKEFHSLETSASRRAQQRRRATRVPYFPERRAL